MTNEELLERMQGQIDGLTHALMEQGRLLAWMGGTLEALLSLSVETLPEAQRRDVLATLQTLRDAEATRLEEALLTGRFWRKIPGAEESGS